MGAPGLMQIAPEVAGGGFLPLLRSCPACRTQSRVFERQSMYVFDTPKPPFATLVSFQKFVAPLYDCLVPAWPMPNSPCSQGSACLIFFLLLYYLLKHLLHLLKISSLPKYSCVGGHVRVRTGGLSAKPSFTYKTCCHVTANAIQSSLYLLRPKTYQWNLSPYQQTTTNHTNAAQSHGQTRPDRIQPHMTPIADNRIKNTRSHWHSNAVINQRPPEIKLDSSEYNPAEIDERQ